MIRTCENRVKNMRKI